MKRVADNHKQGIAETNLIKAQEFHIIRKMIDVNLLPQVNHQTDNHCEIIWRKVSGGTCPDITLHRISRNEKIKLIKHRITEHVVSEGIHKDHQSPTPDPAQDHFQESHCVLESTVQMPPELCQAGAVTPSLGSCCSAQPPSG